jgi:hypothetical protein
VTHSGESRLVQIDPVQVVNPFDRMVLLAALLSVL